MSQGLIRIIAGTWRGRKLKVPEGPGVRPTPDRVRETLFNWLAPILPGAHCLDMFAGSGALGFEAASRGAARVVMTDAVPAIVQLLESEYKTFGNFVPIEIYCALAPEQLRKPVQPFDIVFIDPPWQSDLWLPACFWLETHSFLAPNAHIYLEADREFSENELPNGWQLAKSRKAGDVYYHLAVRAVDSAL